MTNNKKKQKKKKKKKKRNRKEMWATFVYSAHCVQGPRLGTWETKTIRYKYLT